MNLFQFLELAAARYPQKTAVICGADRCTFSALKLRSDQLAASLLRRGIAKGEPVAILSANSIAYVEIICALMKIGAVGVPLNYRLTKIEITSLLEHSAATALFCETDLQELITPFPENLKFIVSLGATHEYAGISYDSLFSQPAAAHSCPAVNEHDPSVIIYTAGTTGEPKGVVLTHGNQIWNTLNYTAALAMTPSDIELAPTPLFHASTLGRVFTYLFNGVTFILCKNFNPADGLSIIARERVTAITQAPTMYQMMQDVFKDGMWDTSSIKRVVSGASLLPATLKKSLKMLFPQAGFYDLYGLTEGGPGISILTKEDFCKKKGSVGKPMLSVEVRIADGNDHSLAPGQVGEILCRGPNIMRGYLNDVAATEDALSGGWLHTGDLGWQDEEGFLYISGRKKDLIISGGTNIYPLEVEEVLNQHPAVKEAAVIGVEDQLWGEKVAAAVVLRQKKLCTEQQLMEFCREHLAAFKCPRSVIFTSELPRNAAQKIMKEELKKLFHK
jgi:fatty-acyl-CoA synthase